MNTDKEKNSNSKNNNIAKSVKSNISQSVEDELRSEKNLNRIRKRWRCCFHNLETKFKKENEQNDGFEDRGIKGKDSSEAEENNTKVAKRKARSLALQRKDNTKMEAERRSKEITKEVKDKARAEVVEKIMQNKEIANMINYSPQEERRKLEIKSNNEHDKLFIPFLGGFKMWQNYSRIWMDFFPQTLNNGVKITKDFVYSPYRVRKAIKSLKKRNK